MTVSLHGAPIDGLTGSSRPGGAWDEAKLSLRLAITP
jgi:hypothetical protein